MNVQRFLAFVLLVSLAIASGPSTVHTSAAPPSVTARSEATGSWRSSGPYGGHAQPAVRRHLADPQQLLPGIHRRFL